MSFTVFLGNLPVWVTADDIKGWLTAENLVADSIKVIRNPETQESKGFAFIDAPNTEEMNAIIRRFDRAPLEDRLLRANPAQPPRPKGPGEGRGRPMGSPGSGAGYGGGPSHAPAAHGPVAGHGSPSGHAPISGHASQQSSPPGPASTAGRPAATHGPASGPSSSAGSPAPSSAAASSTAAAIFVLLPGAEGRVPQNGPRPAVRRAPLPRNWPKLCNRSLRSRLRIGVSEPRALASYR